MRVATEISNTQPHNLLGRMKNSPEKQRKVAVEYVNLCGLSNGQKLAQNDLAKSQEEIAGELGISVPELKRMLEIERKLTPEIKQLIDSGTITKSTAGHCLKKGKPLFRGFNKNYLHYQIIIIFY